LDIWRTLSAGRAVLAGEYRFSEDYDTGTRELLKEVARLRQLVPEYSVDLQVRHPKWSVKWKKAREKTLLSHSGLHFLHYIAGVPSDLSPPLIESYDLLNVRVFTGKMEARFDLHTGENTRELFGI
jgi:hypothetical protein